MRRNSLGSVRGHFRDDAGKFDARRPGADHGEGQKRLAGGRVLLELRLFEGKQHAAADGGRILQRLQPRRHRLPFVVAEIGMRRARGDHQCIVADRLPTPERHRFGGGIDAGHLAQKRRHLRPVAIEMADRPGDLGSGDQRGCDLVEQRLEQVMISPVDQRDAHRRARKPVDELQPAKPSTDDDDMMPVLHGHDPDLTFCKCGAQARRRNRRLRMSPLQNRSWRLCVRCNSVIGYRE